MKKFLTSSFCLVLLLCVTIFGGCLKADSATLKDNIAKFKNDLSSLRQTDTDYGCGLLDFGYNFTFIESSDSYNLTKFINGTSSFNVLNDGEEYDVMLSNASTYFLEKFSDGILTVYSENVDNIPQNLNTQLYHNIESLSSKLKDFKQVYADLIFTVEQNSSDPTSTTNQKKLRKLLNKYEEVIGQVLNLNITAQQIYDYNIIKVTQEYNSITKIPDNEIKRLTETFMLYITNYLYQKHMVFTEVLSEDGTLTKFEDNQLYKNLLALKSALNSAITNETINTEANNLDATNIRIYKYLRECEKDLLNDIKLNNNALEVLEGKIPDADDTQKQLIYKNFYVDYEATLNNYAQLLISLIG